MGMYVGHIPVNGLEAGKQATIWKELKLRDKIFPALVYDFYVEGGEPKLSAWIDNLSADSMDDQFDEDGDNIE